MRPAIDVLVAVQGQTGVRYTRPNGQSFDWPGAIVGSERGGLEEQLDSGDLLKVTRLAVQGPTSTLVAEGVTELERGAVLAVNGRDDWALDVEASSWGPGLVRLELVRRPIARNENMEARTTRG